MCSYAFLAAIAIGYDEIFPVFAKTSRAFGGLGMGAGDIGAVLIFGGVALVAFQLTVFPIVLRLLGVTRGLRWAALAFGAVSLIAPIASVRGVVENNARRWAVALASQTLKIVTLAVLFTNVIMAVNNSCLNRVKARVNGAATSMAALGRIVSPVVHGVIFSRSLRVRREDLMGVPPQFVVFGFVALTSVALFALVSGLPRRLDQPRVRRRGRGGRKRRGGGGGSHGSRETRGVLAARGDVSSCQSPKDSRGMMRRTDLSPCDMCQKGGSPRRPPARLFTSRRTSRRDWTRTARFRTLTDRSRACLFPRSSRLARSAGGPLGDLLFGN